MTRAVTTSTPGASPRPVHLPSPRCPGHLSDADQQWRRRCPAARAQVISTPATLRPSGSLLAISSPFNSLFKVLFIFPSQYLFAIGLPPVFSLRWNLPPALSCNPKQLDSIKRTTSAAAKKQTGLSPSLIPCSKGLLPGAPQVTPATTPEGLATWALPASVALTEGILVSFFSSA